MIHNRLYLLLYTFYKFFWSNSFLLIMIKLIFILNFKTKLILIIFKNKLKETHKLFVSMI